MHDGLAVALRPSLEPAAIACDRGSLVVADSSGAVDRISGELSAQLATLEGRVDALALGPDGAVYVASAGTISCLRDGSATTLVRSGAYSRFGLTHDGDTLYATQHLTSKFGAHEGSVIGIDLRTGVPSTLIDGFHQPIGIAKLGATLVVADARMRAVFRVELRGVARYQLAALNERPSAVCACGDSVLVTTYDATTHRGAVHQIWLARRSRIVASGAWEPRGVATDGERALVASSAGILTFEL